MYEAHFGLTKPLFPSGIAQESAVFFAARHQQLAASIKLALATSDSAVVLTGPAGVGKTALIASALRATSTKLALGWITVAPANAGELLELLLVEFGFNAHRVGRVERIQMWRQFLNEMSATSSRVYVIAERADELGADVLRALDSLTAADPNGSLGANLVLLGQPALLDVLKTPTLASLCQRIRLRQQLQPLAPDELRAYLDHHAKAAGGAFDKLFAPDALAALHDITGGIPRLVNNVGETALTLAATRKNPAVTAQLLREVAQMFGIAPAAEPTREAASATPITGVVGAAQQASAGVAPPAQAAPVVAQPASAAKAAPAAEPAPLVAKAAPAAQPAHPIAKPAPVAAQPVAPAASPAIPAHGAAPASAATPSVAAASPMVTTAPPSRPAHAAPASLDASPSVIARRPALAARAAAPVSTTHEATAPGPASIAPAVPPAPAAPSSAAAPPAAAPPAAAQPRSAVADRQLMTDEEIDSFAATLTESPDVPTFDFPVLTDAVEPSRQRPRAETAYVRPPAARAPAPEPAKPPLPRVVAAASAPPAARAAKPSPAPQPPVSEDADLLRQTQTMRAIAVAKSIDDISSSMAETLFGDADLENLDSALEASGWTEDDAALATPAAASASAPPAAAKLAPQPPPAKAAAPTAAPKPAPPMPAAKPPPPDDDPFDFLGLGRDAPLELIDEPVVPQRKEIARNR